MYIGLYHGYADHLAIDVSTSYFAQALALTYRVANMHLNFIFCYTSDSISCFATSKLKFK